MKITMKTLVVATLCLLLSTHSHSQKLENQIKPLRVGQRLPEIILNKIHNYKATRYALSDMDFKLMIIQLWSSKAVEYTAEYQTLENLEWVNNYNVQFLKVTPETESKILSSLLIDPPPSPSWIPLVTDDRVFTKLFPQVKSTQYIWIDRKRKIIAITNSYAITEENINLALENKPIEIPTLASSKNTTVQ